jgi:hypothetical protein
MLRWFQLKIVIWPLSYPGTGVAEFVSYRPPHPGPPRKRNLDLPGPAQPSVAPNTSKTLLATMVSHWYKKVHHVDRDRRLAPVADGQPVAWAG